MPARTHGPSDSAPGGFNRRSFIYRRLAAAGARFEEVDGAAAATDFGAARAEAERARSLGLADLSPLPRVGFRGPGAMQWLAAQGVSIEAVPNRAWRQADGALAVARSWTEALVLSDLHGRSELCGRLETRSEEAFEAGAYVLPRADGQLWFALTGDQASRCLAKLCAIDLRAARFADGSVAQTSVAGMSAVVVRSDAGAAPTFLILGESVFGEYLWDCLIDAMREFDGGVIGLTALRTLADAIE